MRSPSCFLPQALLKKPSSSGQISLKMTRPTVVSMTLRSRHRRRRSSRPKSGFLKRIRSCVLTAPSAMRELDFGLRRRRAAARSPSPLRRARFCGEVVAAEHDVLRRRHDRLAARGREDVVRRQHEHARFHLRLDRERHVHGHLVTVEVRVVSGANERVNADRFAFDQLRLERLDRQTVQRRRAVQQHRMALGHFLEDVPDFRASGARSSSSRERTVCT